MVVVVIVAVVVVVVVVVVVAVAVVVVVAVAVAVAVVGLATAAVAAAAAAVVVVVVVVYLNCALLSKGRQWCSCNKGFHNYNKLCNIYKIEVNFCYWGNIPFLKSCLVYIIPHTSML